MYVRVACPAFLKRVYLPYIISLKFSQVYNLTGLRETTLLIYG